MHATATAEEVQPQRAEQHSDRQVQQHGMAHAENGELLWRDGAGGKGFEKVCHRAAIGRHQDQRKDHARAAGFGFLRPWGGAGDEARAQRLGLARGRRVRFADNKLRLTRRAQALLPHEGIIHIKRRAAGGAVNAEGHAKGL